MWKQALSVLTVAAGASLALGQDAPSSRITPPSQYMPASGSAVAAPGRPSPYGNYQGTTMTADGSGAAAAPVAPSAGCATCEGGCAAKGGLSGWFSGEYLLLFPSRMNVPVLLRSAAGAPLAGGSRDLGNSSGFKIDTGTWLKDGEMAIQGIAFGSFRSYVTTNVAAGVIPIVGFPLPVTGFAYQSWHQIAGGEGNTLLHVAGDGPTKVYGLAGTRYMNLEEDITLRYFAPGFGGSALDEFHTRNQFVGGQVGAMLIHHAGKVNMELTGKIALGVNNAQQFILGSNNVGLGVQAFTGRSNIGYYESNYFGMIPEVNAKIGYQLTERLSANVGYMFLMSINNWRPGDQISLTSDGGVTQPRVAPPIRSTYYLHGLTAGLTFRY